MLKGISNIGVDFISKKPKVKKQIYDDAKLSI